MGLIVCPECGKQFSDKAKACPQCGCPLEVILNELSNIDSNIIDDEGKEDFRGFIKDHVIDAYVNGITIVKPFLYKNAENYAFTEQMVDDYVDEIQTRIAKFVKFLENKYLNGIYLMLDCSDEILNENNTYACRLGFLPEDAAIVQKKFLKEHNIKKKATFLAAIILTYQKSGVVKDVVVKDNGCLDTEFMENEYSRLKVAISELKEYQSFLHKEYNSDVLSNQDKNELYQKGIELGFIDREYINGCIDGNEIRLGYFEKNKQKEIASKHKIQDNLLSSIVEPRKIMLLGSNIKFESCYFVEKETIKYFKDNISKLRNKVIEKCEELDILNQNISLGLPMIIFALSTQWGQMVEDYCQKAKLDQSIYQNIKDYFHNVFMCFGDDLKDIGNLFIEIDEGVDNVQLENQLRKANRGRWMIGGFGLDGIVMGAVTGAVLNAGTGLAYDAVNSILAFNSRKNARKAKETLLNAAIKSVEDFFEMLIDFTAPVVLQMIVDEYPYAVWQKDEEQEKYIRNLYLKEKEDEKRVEYVKKLLKQNPMNLGNYQYVFSEILKTDENGKQKNTDNLITIYTWFNQNPNRVKESIIKGLNKQYDNDDIKGYEELVRDEKLLKMTNATFSRKRLDYLIKNCVKDIKDYSPEEVSEAIAELKKYKDKDSSGVEFEIKKLQENVLKKFGVMLDTNSKLVVEKNIEYLEAINNSYDFDVSRQLKIQNQILRNIEYEEGIESRKTEVIIAFEIASNTYEYKTILFDNAEDKDAAKTKDDQLRKLCSGLRLNMNAQEWDKCVLKIEELIKGNNAENYYEKLVQSIKEQRIEAEKQERTVNGIEYNTKQEAQIAKEELKLIETIEKKYIQKSKVYYEILQHEFKTQQVREIIRKKEEDLISHYACLLVERQSSDVMTKTANAVGAFIISTIATIIIAIVGLMFTPLGLIIGLVVILGIWGGFGEKVSNVKSSALYAEHVKEEIAEFENLFKVIDHHIVLKNAINKPVKVDKQEIKEPLKNVENIKTIDSSIAVNNVKTENDETIRNISIQMDTMFCAFCGKQIVRTAKFCNFCGRENSYDK